MGMRATIGVLLSMTLLLGSGAARAQGADGGAVAALDRDLGILRDGLARDEDAVTLPEWDALAALKARPDVLFLAYFNERRAVRWFGDPALIASPYADFARRYPRADGALDRVFRTKTVQFVARPGDAADILIPVLDGNRVAGAIDLAVIHPGAIPRASRGRSRVSPAPKDDAERRHWLNALVLYMAGEREQAGAEIDACLGEAPRDADCRSLRRRL